MNAASDEYAFEKPATRTTPSYDSPKCRTMLLPRIPYGEVSFSPPLADHAEPVGVVDVEERAVLAGDPGERAQVGGVAGDAVHAVHADDARCRERSSRSSRSRSSGSSNANRFTVAPRARATWQPS